MRYFRQVKKHIPIGGTRRKEFLANMQDSLVAYSARNPDADLADYYEQFGRPDDIAISFLSEMPYAEINRKIRIGRKVLIIMMCITLVTAIALSLTVAYMVTENQNSHDGYVVEDEPEILTNID